MSSTGREMRLEFTPGSNGNEEQSEVLRRITDAVTTMGAREGWGEETSFQVNLVLEEISVNAMTHGEVTPGMAPRMEIMLDQSAGRLTIEISDAGRAFNPLEDAPPTPLVAAGVRAPTGGGLGLHLVRSIVEDISYRHDGQMNRLRMTLTCGEER